MADGDAVLLATGGYDHTIRLWQPHSGVCHRTLQHPESVRIIIKIQSFIPYKYLNSNQDSYRSFYPCFFDFTASEHSFLNP